MSKVFCRHHFISASMETFEFSSPDAAHGRQFHLVAHNFYFYNNNKDQENKRIPSNVIYFVCSLENFTVVLNDNANKYVPVTS
jgi:hypothetical protein